MKDSLHFLLKQTLLAWLAQFQNSLLFRLVRLISTTSLGPWPWHFLDLYLLAMSEWHGMAGKK
jgi:hypothetical protein